MIEPVLTEEDRHIWEQWTRLCMAHARSERLRHRVDAARRAIDRMATEHPAAYVAWSAGKDSTALVHLVRVECGIPGRVMSVKDDLDFPGEEDYVRHLGAAWGLDLAVIHPPFSLQAWVAEHAADLVPGADIHGRSAGLSRDGFYRVVAAYRHAAGTPGVYLGLRSEESGHRARNRASHGLLYRKADGETVCQPIADWRAEDVYGYLLARGIELLPVYRCVRLAEHPGRVRKSWWLPGASARHGAAIWLRTYYPTLHARLLELMPGAAALS